MLNKNDNAVVYQARLHWIIFTGPLLMLMFALLLMIYSTLPSIPLWALAGMALLWGGITGLTYHYSYLDVKKKRVVMCSGFIVRQTVDIPLAKIESIDIRQSILGSIFQYGSLLITGTGGTRQYMHLLSKPLVCRRCIEELMSEIS